jgi:hypothetical protein
MSYERKELQILGGGFNMLPPGDKVPETDYLLAQNWRIDRAGKLVSRNGYVAAAGGTWSGVQYLHSAAPFAGDVYWAGNTTGVNPGIVFFDLTSIKTGLSGNRVGMVPLNGWMWIVDSSTGGFRHNATSGVQTWGIPAQVTQCNAFAGAAGTDPGGPSGSYVIYYTYLSSDLATESNPSPGSNPFPLNGSDPIVQVFASSNTLVGSINIYAIGGTLTQPYRIANVANTSVVVTFNATDHAANGGSIQVAQWSDLSVTNAGIVMPTRNDLPVPMTGLAGPYFDKLVGWNAFAAGAVRVNRLWWTPAGQPQYWPGANQPATGNWVDVGADGEAILWVTVHPNALVIYKQYSIWWLVGTPETGQLEKIEDIGAVNAWAVTAGESSVDYFVAPNGLYQLTLAPSIQLLDDKILPIFQDPLTNSNTLQPPGRVINETGTPYGVYGVTLGWGMGKLYVSIREQGPGDTNPNALFVWNGKKWMYHRSSLYTRRVFGFLFAGIAMWGLGGNLTSTGVVYNLDDFSQNFTEDNGTTPIECVYQSHYEDAGVPDSQKNWIEVVIDYEFAGDTATVYVALNGTGPDAETTIALTNITTITGSARLVASIPLGIDSSGGALVLKTPSSPSTVSDGALGKSISVAIDCSAAHVVKLHNVYLYYYEEQRLGKAASSIPQDLGSGKVKQVKELMLDVDATNGVATCKLYSDLPGNALAVRQTISIAQGSRAVIKYPFAVTEGFLWRLAANAITSFRLYSARVLARVVGVYVEAYEATAGFVWDSMEQTFDSGITHVPRQYAIALASLPIKRFREIRLEIDTFNANVSVSLLTDLPGEAQTVRNTTVVNSGAVGRRFFPIVLPSGLSAPIEGRMARLQISGTSKFILYEAAIEVLAVGVYVAPADVTSGAVFDSREHDFGSAKPKDARELELDIETTGSITATLYSDLPNLTMAQVFQSTTVSTSGRQTLRLPLTVNALTSSYPIGRLFRLILSGANPWRLYGAKLRIREFGTYLTSDEATGGGVWDSTPLGMGTELIKSFKRLELDIQTDASSPATITILTDQSGTLASVNSTTVQTGGARQTVVFNFTPGTRGRLIQVQVSAVGTRLWAGRIWWRPLNQTQQTQWDWAPLPIAPTAPQWVDAPFPVNPTPPGNEPAQWWWAKLLSVEETSDVWAWVDIPFDVR